MVAEDDCNEAWHDEIEGSSSTFIAAPFCESAAQKAGRPGKYEGSCSCFRGLLSIIITTVKTSYNLQFYNVQATYTCAYITKSQYIATSSLYKY